MRPAPVIAAKLEDAAGRLFDAVELVPKAVAELRTAAAVGYPTTASGADSGGGSPKLGDDGHPTGLDRYLDRDGTATDATRGEARELDKLADRLARDAAAASDLLTRWARTETAKPKPTKATRPACEQCGAPGLGVWRESCTENPTTVRGNLPKPAHLCRWHYDYVRQHGHKATRRETETYLTRLGLIAPKADTRPAMRAARSSKDVVRSIRNRLAEHRRRETVLVAAIAELHAFIVDELDPDPHPHPAGYLTGDRAELVSELIPRKDPKPCT